VWRSQAVDGVGSGQSESLWRLQRGADYGPRHPEAGRGHAPSPSSITRLKDIVYDPFLGSGTTLIAAELTDRVCYGLEIAPSYVDLIVKRWQDLTGKKDVLEADGRTFAQVAEERTQIEEVQPCPAQN
jgi:hypothetical protein